MLNVDVAVRVRPFLAEEQEDNKKIKWKIRNTKVTRVRDPNLKRKHFIGDEFLFGKTFICSVIFNRCSFHINRNLYSFNLNITMYT